MSQWTPEAIAGLVTAIAGLATAIGATIGALKAHQKINDHYENDHTDMPNVDTSHDSSGN